MRSMIKDVRLSYVRLFNAAQMNGTGEANYSVCLLIPKDGPEARKLKEAIKAEVQNLVARYPKLAGKQPKIWNNPLRDGDVEKDGAEYEGMYFVNCKRKEKQGAPILIDGKKLPITDRNELYSGCYGNVAISLYPYEFSGKYGIGVGLNGVQKVRDGERLDGGTSVDDFDCIDDDDDMFA